MPEQPAISPDASLIPLDEQGFIASIDCAALETQPCDHISLRDLFPPAFYRQLLDSVPPVQHFHELRHRDAIQPDGRSARLRLYLYPEQLWFLPAALRARWSPLARLLMSKALEDAFKRKFQRALEARFGCPIDRLKLYPVPIIVRDLPGYRIGIHADIPKKAITVQFYLPRDESQRHLGTVFHEGQSGEAALRIRKMQFLPASGYAFPVQKAESWHSAEMTTPADGERMSILLTYYVQDTVKHWFSRRYERLLSFLDAAASSI
jgi:hypothetical protein